jgi:predicted ATPase
LRFAPEDGVGQKLDKIAATLAGLGLGAGENVPLIAALLDLPATERYPAPDASPQQLKAKILDLLIAVVEAMAAEAPVLMVVEDAHWMDPSTKELLGLLIERLRSTRIQLVLIVRPEFEPPWSGQPHLTSLALNRLSRRDTAALITKVTGGKDLPGPVLEEILAKTDGIPLFVEELTKTVLESGVLEDPALEHASAGALSTLAIPTSLQDSLMARLDRLAPVKEVAQLGATIGRVFGHELLAAVSPLDEDALESALERLADAELVYRRGRPPTASYEFKHAMVQEVAYQSLLKSTRQQYHKAIAQALEGTFPETANSQPELVARHYTESGEAARAIPFWHRAGRRAVERSANHEAVAHCTKALELVRKMPESPERRQQELALLLVQGPALMPTKGFGSTEVRDIYDRARVLCEGIDETEPLFPVTWGLWQSRQARGETDAACEIADELLEIAERQTDKGLLLQAHHSAWTSRFARDELRSVHTHAERGIALYDFAAHRDHAFDYGGHDPGVCCRVIGGMTSCFLGQPDRARDLVIDAAALADQLGHPFSTALAHSFSATVYLFRREPRRVRTQADALAAICSEHGFPFFRPMEPILRGWALAADGEVSEGVTTIQEGLDAIRAGGVNRRLSFQLALLAEACAWAGDTERGLEALTEAETVIEATGEHRWEAEVHRLKGEMLATRSDADGDDAEAHLNRALDVARRQEAKWFELRAATALARLWAAQGKRAEARDMLAPVYGWFSEGFDTPDLTDAKALLDELA